MLNSLFQYTPKYISFEDVQNAIKNQSKYIIINTLSTNEQTCLIKNTTNIENEETLMNELLSTYEHLNKKVVIYGKNCNDESVNKKHKQLRSLGFTEVFIYLGGLFEWLLLQDIYGDENFPTTKKTLDIYKYRASNCFT
jgi:Rhodanese-like domain